MSRDGRAYRTAALLLAVALLLAALLAGQAGADALVPAGPAADTGRSLGRTADAYLSGLRLFASYVLWNKLEPQFDDYYSGLKLKDQKFLMPNLRLVLFLDPQFVQAAYDVPWILVDNGRLDEALAVALQGAVDNPRSGLLRMSYAQLLFLRTNRLSEAAHQADLALAPEMQWRDPNELWENLRIAKDIYQHAGQTAKVESVDASLASIEKQFGGASSIPGAGSRK